MAWQAPGLDFWPGHPSYWNQIRQHGQEIVDKKHLSSYFLESIYSWYKSCFNWMICNLYLDSGYFTKHPFENGDPDLVDGLVTLWITNLLTFGAWWSVAAWNLMASHLFRNLDFLLAFIFSELFFHARRDQKNLDSLLIGVRTFAKKESNSEERKHDSNF